MSLEIKIENLTLAINALNINIAKLVNVPICDEPELAAEILDRELPKAKKKKEAVVEVEAVTESIPSLTMQDVKNELRVMTRKALDAQNESFKNEVKGILSDFSASKVTDLAVDQLVDFMNKVEALKI
jgi:hypothetical protein|tara:strand:+ start:4267 stop:4650 length:384 start_codon:yes stop_codon:yes gene_type:complete